MKKFFLLIGLLLLFPSWARAEYVIDNCDSIPNNAVERPTGTVCSQTGSTGRNPGIYWWDGAAWQSTGAAGSGHVIEDEGTPQTQRANLNFVGGGVTASDSNPDTLITIPGPNLPLAGGTLTGQLVTDNLGIEFEESDVNPACAAGNYNIYADLSETSMKMCQDGVASKLGNLNTTDIGVTVQGFDSDLQALGANSTNGIWARTGPGAGAARTITGTTNKIDVTNGDGVSGNPVLNRGTDIVDITRTNVYGAFLQDFGAATMELPNAPGGDPSTNQIIIDTTADKLKVNIDGVDHNVALEGGNIATATAFAADPADCNRAAGLFTYGINASGVSDCDTPIAASAATPSPNSSLYPGQLRQDTRAYSCTTAQGLTYYSIAAAGNFAPIIAQADGYVTFGDGVNTTVPCGADSISLRGSGGVTFEAFNKSSSDFTNQPSNVAVELVSSSASDGAGTTYKVCGTLTGGNDRDVTCSTGTLNGTTFVTTPTSTYNFITNVLLGGTPTVGTVTVRRANDDATIITMAPGVMRASYQDMFLLTVTSSMDITGLTEDTAPDSAADFIPTFDTSAGSNKKVKPANITATWELTYKAVSCDVTTGTLLLDSVDTNKPTPTCTLGAVNTTMVRGVAVFPDSDGDFSVQDSLELPDTWVGALDATITWRTTLTSGNVAWQLSTLCRANGEVDDVAWNTAQVITDTAAGTTLFLNTVTQTGVTTTGCAAGEKLRWKLVRNRTHASDTLGAGTPDLVSIKFKGRRTLGS